MSEFIRMMEGLFLWQICIVISIFLLVLGFTGGIPFTEVVLREGRSEQAISTGGAFFLISVILKLMLTIANSKRGDDK